MSEQTSEVLFRPPPGPPPEMAPDPSLGLSPPMNIPTKWYLAAPYADRARIREVIAAELRCTPGHEVVSTWHDQDRPEFREFAGEEVRDICVQSMAGIIRADVFVQFTAGHLPSAKHTADEFRGLGSHVELGLALGLHLARPKADLGPETFVLVGPLTNLFHGAREVHHYWEWSDIDLALYRNPKGFQQ